MAATFQSTRFMVSALALAAALFSCGNVTPGTVPGTLTIAQVAPSSGATDVSPKSALVITFTAPIAPSSLKLELEPSVNVGTVTFSDEDRTAMFDSVALAPGTRYQAKVGARGAAGETLEGIGSFEFTTGAAPDVAPPTLVTSRPAAGAVDVLKGQVVSLVFSEPMDPLSLTVTLEPAVDLGAASWSMNDTVAIFVAPTSAFTPGQAYTLNVVAADKAGNSLPAVSLGFSVKSDADMTGPTVAGSAPVAAAASVPVNASVAIVFSEPMNPASVDAALTIAPAVPGTVSWDETNTIRTVVPLAPLASNTLYTVSVASGAKDVAGNALAMVHSHTFTTAAAADTMRPSFVSSTPAAGTLGVARSANIQVTFSEPMDKAATQAAFSVTAPANLNQGTFSWSADGMTMTFNPTTLLPFAQAVTWRVSNAAKDLAGNSMLLAVFRGFTVIKQGTMVLDSTGTLDGWAKSSGATYPNVADLYVGDSHDNLGSRAFLTFDLNALPPTTERIITASLYVYVSSTFNDPITSLGGAGRLERVAYGGTLTAAAYALPRATFVYDSVPLISTPSTGWKMTNQIGSGVSDDWTNRMSRGGRTQFRIAMPNEVSPNSLTNSFMLKSGKTASTTCARTNAAAMGSSCKPHLVLSYEYR